MAENQVAPSAEPEDENLLAQAVDAGKAGFEFGKKTGKLLINATKKLAEKVAKEQEKAMRRTGR
jgi:hypothetical protein